MVEALEPLIVPAVVLVTINFWATCFVQKSSKYMLPCFVLFMAHLSLSRSSDLLAEALPKETPASHLKAYEALVRVAGTFFVLGLTHFAPEEKSKTL